MCLALETRVALAMKTHADINKTCCKKGDKVCPLCPGAATSGRCKATTPEVWITAHDMLFHAQPAFGKPEAVIIDERMWHKGIRGIEDEREWEVPLDSLITDAAGAHRQWRRQQQARALPQPLGRALMQQDDNGGVERKHLDAALSPYALRHSPAARMELMPKLGQHPAMSEAEIAALANDKDTIDAVQHTRRVIQIWEAARDLLKEPSIAVSGRLSLQAE